MWPPANRGSLGRAGEEDGGELVKCLTTNLEVNYPCSTVCALYGDCVTAFLKAKKQRVRTNADRIRAMSDEELAEAMDMLCPPVKDCTHDGNCVKCWIYWLRQPAEED